MTSYLTEDESVVKTEVFARVELLAARRAREAVDVIDEVTHAHDELVRGDTTTTLRATLQRELSVSNENKMAVVNIANIYIYTSK